MTCDHSKWIYPEPYEVDYCGHSWVEHPEPYQEKTYEELPPGRFRCTQCQEVGYYTGLWRQHFEGGRKLLDENTGCVRSV